MCAPHTGGSGMQGSSAVSAERVYSGAGAHRTVDSVHDIQMAKRTVIFAVKLLLLGLSTGFAEAGELSALELDGRALAEKMCSQCHAVGKSGLSPHSSAPAFRALDRRLDLDSFANRLREGVVVGHPDMPMFRFSREDARALVAYLRSIGAP